MNTNTQQKGFSIIEVVLVLAIAALIFLMIFIALPALQRGQRDTARKQDASTVATALNTWRGNHRGTLPGDDDWGDFEQDYVKNLGQYDVGDDATFIYTIEPGESPDEDTLTTDTIAVLVGAQCSDDGAGTQDGSTRSAAVLIRLEASGAIICTDA